MFVWVTDFVGGSHSLMDAKGERPCSRSRSIPNRSWWSGCHHHPGGGGGNPSNRRDGQNEFSVLTPTIPPPLTSSSSVSCGAFGVRDGTWNIGSVDGKGRGL